MTQEQATAVVEFGPAHEPERKLTGKVRERVLSRVRLDDRAIPAVAGLGAVTVFVSLLSDWQMTSVNVEDTGLGAQTTQDVSAGLTDLGSWGTGYLMGVFGLVACLALVLFGAPAVRRHARLAGLGVSGALLALLVAVAVELGRNSLVYPVFYIVPQEPAVSYRPGVYLAFLGVAGLGLALYLAGRLPAPSGTVDTGTGDRTESLWRWRRRQASVEPRTEDEAGPVDLTVSPAAPFVQPSDR